MKVPTQRASKFEPEGIVIKKFLGALDWGCIEFGPIFLQFFLTVTIHLEGV